MTAVYILIGLVAGLAIGWLAGMAGKAPLKAKAEALESDRDRAVKAADEERRLGAAALDEERRRGEKAVEEERRRWQQTVETERQRIIEENRRSQSDVENLWKSRFDALKQELQKLTADALISKQNVLQETNREQIGEILKPIREQFDAFRKSVEESRTSGEVAKKELKDSFEHTMELFRQMQQTTVASLKEETMRIGNEAANLTRALKRDTKKQGDWGEMILETLLESSGLEKGVHYKVQENVKDDEGNNLRPDVVVHFPEGRSVVIDSKVSLKAYAEAFETEDLSIKERCMKAHAKSVRHHVDELVAKKYDTLVKNSIGFVLMFIPNDQSYLTAMEYDPDLGNYSFAKGVIIISPSNLMISLILCNNLWKQDARNKNIDRIVKEATDLYDKVAGFQSTFENVEKAIGKAREEMEKARGQLYGGKGNIFGRVENIRKLGLTPKKQLKEIPPE